MTPRTAANEPEDGDSACWTLIESTCQRPLSVSSASSALEAALHARSADEVARFCRFFDRRMDDAYHWDLWGVAYLVNGGCSDDAFMDFRASLIALGESTWRAVVDDAEALMDLPRSEREALFEEGFLYCGPRVHEALVGTEPARRGSGAGDPAGEEWEETRAALMARFPRAWAEHGWEEAPPSAPVVPGPRKPWWRFW